MITKHGQTWNRYGHIHAFKNICLLLKANTNAACTCEAVYLTDTRVEYLQSKFHLISAFANKDAIRVCHIVVISIKCRYLLPRVAGTKQ